jgi:hypothetical protein
MWLPPARTDRRLTALDGQGAGSTPPLGASKGIVSKHKRSPYRSGRTEAWVKMKNSEAPAVSREAEEDWGGQQSRL